MGNPSWERGFYQVMRGLEKYTGGSAKGFTIIELMMVIVIMAILLALATPSVKSMIDKQRVRGTCESIYQNLALARSSAVSLNKDVTFNFRNPGTAWCLGLYDSSVASCDCSGASSGLCTVNGITRTASYYDFGGGSGDDTSVGTVSVTGTSLASNTLIVFDARDATPSVTNADFLVKSSFWACKIKLEALGQVKYYKSNRNTTIVPATGADGELVN